MMIVLLSPVVVEVVSRTAHNYDYFVRYIFVGLSSAVSVPLLYCQTRDTCGCEWVSTPDNHYGGFRPRRELVLLQRG